MTKVEQANQLFSQDYNCTQAIVVSFNNLNLDKNTIKFMTSGFGAGCGSGELCGAIVGGVLSLGLMAKENEILCKENAKKLMNYIEQQYGGVNCKDILNCNINTDEGVSKFIENKLFETKCTKLVEDVAKYLENVLQTQKGN